MSVINTMLKNIERRQSGLTQQQVQESVVVAPIYDYQAITLKIMVIVFAIITITLAYFYLPEATNNKRNELETTVIPTQLEENLVSTALPVKDTDNTLVQGENEITESGENKVLKSHVNNAKTIAENLPDRKEIVELRRPPQEAMVPIRVEIPVINKENNNIDAFKIKKTTDVPTAQQQAQALLSQAKQALEFGLQQEAINDLLQILHRNPTHLEARSLLAAIYFSQQDILSAQSILEEGISYDSQVLHWRVLLSKIYITRQQYSVVLQLLSDEFDSQGDSQFWILKGTAAQQLGDHGNALRCFEKLTALQPQEGKWWLALATSKDAQGDYLSAKRYYQTAITVGGLSTSILNHAKQRLIALEGVS